MRVNCSNYIDVEEEIKRYYRSLEEKEILVKRLKLYKGYKEKVENDINNSNITLNPDIKAISYELEKVQSNNNNCSPQEKEIERAFKKLEIELKMYKIELMNIEAELAKIDKSVVKMNYIFNKLDDTSKDIMKMIYKDNKTCIEIKDILSMDRATVYRRREKILNYIKSFYSSN